MSSTSRQAIQLSTLTDLDRYNGPGTPEKPELFSVRIAKLYLKTSVDLLDKLRAGQAAADPEAVRFAAHTLKSGTAMVGAAGLAASLSELEHRARSGSIEGSDETIDAVEQEY